MDRNELFRNTGLSKKDQDKLMHIAESIGLYAEVTGCDLFIDCICSDKSGRVIAHGRPKESLYRQNIAGESVRISNEPMVFFTFQSGIGLTDARALSQENRMVQQQTVPIRNDSGDVIAVLIREQDMTVQYELDRRMEDLEDVTEKIARTGLVNEGIADFSRDINNVLLQETHHRIKNNLQTISSILSMQQRRSGCEETREVLEADIRRIDSLASMYEVMMSAEGNQVDMYQIAEAMIEQMQRIQDSEALDVRFTLSGDRIHLDGVRAQALTIILNELLQNGLKHGFRGRKTGEIAVSLIDGSQYRTMVVRDNGSGYEPESGSGRSLGLNIVRALTQDKLKGTFSITGSPEGTIASVQFRR